MSVLGPDADRPGKFAYVTSKDVTQHTIARTVPAETYSPAVMTFADHDVRRQEALADAA